MSRMIAQVIANDETPLLLIECDISIKTCFKMGRKFFYWIEWYC